MLDLCAHMFHPKDASHDVSGTMEYNEMKQEERIRELEKAGALIAAEIDRLLRKRAT